MEQKSDVMIARSQLIEAKKQFARGEISQTALYAAADQYLEAMKLHCKARGLKLKIPTRAQIIRQTN